MAARPGFFRRKRPHGVGDDTVLVKAALTRIRTRGCGEGCQDENPLLSGLVVNDKAKKIKAWECEGGIAERPDPQSETMPEKPEPDAS